MQQLNSEESMRDKTIRLFGQDSLEICAIGPSDLENLRVWKNAHRQFFFHRQEIQPVQQQEWYAGYMQRPNDYMFIVKQGGQAIGCMGIRLLEDGWDVYNVILGIADFAGRGLMGRALQLILKFARDRRHRLISLKVLKKNPAIGWYKKNGFRITADDGDHLIMQHFTEAVTEP